MVRKFLIVFSISLLAGPVARAEDNWSLASPESGSVRDIQADPSNNETLYAVTFGNLFRSTDSGANWAPVGLQGFEQLAINPFNPSVFFGLSARRVWRSANAGVSWTPTEDGLPQFTATRLAWASDGTLYTGTFGFGVYRTNNSGFSWEPANAGISDRRIQTLAVSPTNPALLLAGTDIGEIFRSADQGESWELILSTPLAGTIMNITWDLLQAGTIYAATLDGFYKTTDGGNEWTELNGKRGTSIAIDPTNPEILYGHEISQTQMPGVIRSLDGGETWAAFDEGLLETTGVERIFVNASGIPYLGTNRGVYQRETVDGAWTSLNRGLTAYTPRILDLDREDPNVIYSLTFSEGVQRSENGGQSWTNVTDFTALDLVVDPTTSGTVYVATLTDKVLRSTNRGTSWEFFDEGLDANEVIVNLEAAANGTIYALTQSSQIYQRRSGDLTWGLVPFTGFPEINWMATSAADPEVIYVAGSGGVYRSGDEGATWVEVGDNLENPISQLTADPNDANVLFALGRMPDPGILRSLDGGANWSLMRSGIYTSPFVDPTSSAMIYAGDRNGVLRSRDRGLTWEFYRAGMGVLPTVSRVNDFARVPGSALYAGVSEKGVFRTDPAPRVISLRNGRFAVELDWDNGVGETGEGLTASVSGNGGAVDLRSEDSAVIEFFGGNNWEMLIKVLDATRLNGRFWVFSAAATDVAIETTVTDTSCGTTKVYRNPLGMPAQAVTDTEAFTPCEEPVPPSCSPSEGVLCLGEDDRFQVEITWSDGQGNSGPGRQVEVAEAGPATSRDSGLLYFFSADNWEMLVKVLDACSINDHFWVFSAAATNVEYTLRVTDTVAGVSNSYTNPLGTSAPALTDIGAFATCAP